jgi:hypothetical protein
MIRWESAKPVLEALKREATPEIEKNYILNMIGDVPSVVADRLEMLKDYTKLEHKGDRISVNRVEPSPKNGLSPAGTLFYFSRGLALAEKDKQATFVTRVGPIDIKCKFTLREMLYHGKLEL